MIVGIWGGTLLIYLAFRFWYDGLRKPLTSIEIENFSNIFEKKVADDDLDAHDFAVVRKFMEEDDGREFIMTNLLEMNASPLKHPDTGEDIPANELLLQYFKPLMKTFLRRAGHPVLTLRVVGGYLDAWNTPPNPGWHVVGLVRYRSRRDAMLASLAESSFAGIHKYKIAALKQTFAVPTQINMGLYPSPRFTVAVILALGAALLQLAMT